MWRSSIPTPPACQPLSGAGRSAGWAVGGGPIAVVGNSVAIARVGGGGGAGLAAPQPANSRDKNKIRYRLFVSPTTSSSAYCYAQRRGFLHVAARRTTPKTTTKTLRG